jgi:hypothetical protein
MTVSLADVAILCRVCHHPTHHDRVCRYIEPIVKGPRDSHRCRCGEVRGTTNLNRGQLDAAEDMPPRRTLIRRKKD